MNIAETIKLIGGGSKDETEKSSFDTERSVTSYNSINFQKNGLKKPNKRYQQREGEFVTKDDDDGIDILDSDYPQFVDESKTLDCNLNSFEAYKQIYEAFNRHVVDD